MANKKVYLLAFTWTLRLVWALAPVTLALFLAGDNLPLVLFGTLWFCFWAILFSIMEYGSDD